MTSNQTYRTGSLARYRIIAGLTAQTIGLILVFSLSSAVSSASSDVYDQVGGSVAGSAGRAITVTLYAWGGRPPGNIVQLVATAQQTIDSRGRFNFTVARSQGQQAARQAGISFRGWAVRLMGTYCGELHLLPPAQPLRDNCEAGWLIRPWQQTALTAAGTVMFTIAGTPQIVPSSPIVPAPPTPPTIITPAAAITPANPLAQVTATLTNQTPSPDLTPQSDPPSATPTGAALANDPGTLPLATSTAQIIALPPNPAPAPTSPDNLAPTLPPPTLPSLTSTPIAEATLPPFIIDSHPPLNIPTALPTSAANLAQAGNPTSTSGLIPLLAPPPATPVSSSKSAANGSQASNGPSTIIYVATTIIAFMILLMIIRLVVWWRGRRTSSLQNNYAVSEATPTGYSAGHTADNPAYGAAFQLPDQGAQYRANQPTVPVPTIVNSQDHRRI